MSTEVSNQSRTVTKKNTVVREVAIRNAGVTEDVERIDSLHVAICPECGTDLGQPTSQQVPRAGIADHEKRRAFDESGVPTFGWRCNAHNGYAVVCPYDHTDSRGPCGDYLDRQKWTGLLYRLADERPVWIAVPEQEVP